MTFPNVIVVRAESGKDRTFVEHMLCCRHLMFLTATLGLVFQFYKRRILV